MKKLIFSFLALFMLSPISVLADDNLNKIFKLEVYDYEVLNDSYYLKQYGSSVLVDNGLVYTNAHVILDNENQPIGNYRVCRTIDFKNKPVCFSVGKLLYYDVKNDLAALQITGYDGEEVKISDKSLEIGEVVKVYGYPSNGGETITYTEGKISGYEDGLYKIDANIDAGNSGGGVFNMQGELIGMAVSVKVGYTTLGYVIPVSKINDFKLKKNRHTIDEYDKNINKDFYKHHLTLKNIVGKTSFEHPDFDISNIARKGFKIDGYIGDVDKNYYSVLLKDKNSETSLYLFNQDYFGKNDLSIDDMYKKAQKREKDGIESDDEGVYKIRKLKLKGKDAILYFNKDKDDNVYLGLQIETNKNNYHTISIYSDNIKNKSFLNAVKIALGNINLKDTIVENDGDVIKLDSLKFDKQPGFYTDYGYWGERLKYFGDDIEIGISTTAEFDVKQLKDYSYEKLLREVYSQTKDYTFIGHMGVEKSKKGVYYTYAIIRSNQFKGGVVNEDMKKYGIIVNIVHEKDDKKYYSTQITFKFEDKKSKQKIEKFLDGLSKDGYKSILELGDIKVGESISEKDFDL